MTNRVFLLAFIVAGFVTLLTAAAIAQTIIPVDARFPPPGGLHFAGSWKCEDASGGGTLRVGRSGNRTRWHSASFAAGWHSRPLASTWTEVTEKNEYLVGHYFVAYDRDKRQFIMIDADDPAYAAYATDGWRDRALTLTSEGTQLMPKHRLVYKIDDRNQFTVVYAVWNDESWVPQSSSTCHKVGER
jgi:hypothetical protein